MIRSNKIRFNLLALVLLGLVSSAAAQDNEPDELSGSQRARLSQLRLLTRHLNFEQKCDALAQAIREQVFPDETGNNEQTLMRTVRVLRQRKLPMNNRQPILVDLEDCLHLPHSEDDQESETGAKLEVIAGPPSMDQGKVEANSSMDLVKEEWRSVKDNVKDFGQDLYRVREDGSHNNKIINIPITNGGSPSKNGQAEAETSVSDDHSQVQDDIASQVTHSPSDGTTDVIREIPISGVNESGDTGSVAGSWSQSSGVGAQASASASASVNSGKYRRIINHESYSYSSSKTGQNTISHSSEYNHSSSSDDPDDDTNSDQKAEASVSPGASEKPESVVPGSKDAEQLNEAIAVIESLSSRLDAEIENLNRQVQEMEQTTRKIQEHEQGTDALVEKSRFKTMKELYERSVKREEELSKKVHKLEEELKQAQKANKKLKETEGDGDVVDKLEKVASKMSKFINPKASIWERCYKYYLALTLSEKPTKKTLKTIGMLNTGNPPINLFNENASILTSLADTLTDSTNSRAVEVGEEILTCLVNSPKTTVWTRRAEQNPQKFKPIPPIPPIPPMPPMPVSYQE